MKSHLLHAHLTAQFKGVAPERVYEAYVNATQHARATGQPASIVAKEGGEFSAYGGYLSGRFIKPIPKKCRFVRPMQDVSYSVEVRVLV